VSKMCDAVREDLSAYIDGMLSEDEAKRVKRHLAECETCREEHQFLSGILKSAATMPEVSVSDRFRAELHKKLTAAAEESKPMKIRKRPIWQLASGFVAAAAVIAFSVVSFNNLPKQSDLTPFVPTPSVKQLEATAEKTETENNPISTEAPANSIDQGEQVADKKQMAPTPQPVAQNESEASQTQISEEIAPLATEAPEQTTAPMLEDVPVTADTTTGGFAAGGGSGGGGGAGIARAAMPFMKTGMRYSVSEEDYSKALELLSNYRQEGNGYLVPDEEIASVCETLEALEGYTGHSNTAETLDEPTDEQVALYSTHTLIVIEVSE